MPTLTVTAGVRYDLFASSSQPLLNQFFVAREGFANNEFVDGRGLVQPRVGFDWKATPRLDIHGGVGIFGGGTPDVYIGNSFSSSGVQPVLFGTNSASSPFLQNVSLTSVPPGATAALAERRMLRSRRSTRTSRSRRNGVDRFRGLMT